MEYGIVWILFLAGVVFLGLFVTKKMRQVKKVQKEAQAHYQANREKFRTLTSEMFDQIPEAELTHAVLFHIMGKEDKIFEGETIEDVELIDMLTHGEKLIYTLYQVELSMEGGRGSIHSFFVNAPYVDFAPYAMEAFNAIRCHEAAQLMKAAARLAQIIEEDLEDDENDIEGDYATYNFADYTNELMTMLKTNNIVDLAGKYIKEHKEDFIDQEVIENEERISE